MAIVARTHIACNLICACVIVPLAFYGEEVKFKVEFYCVKCRAKRQATNYSEETTKNGRRAARANCPICNTVMYKIMGKA